MKTDLQLRRFAAMGAMVFASMGICTLVVFSAHSHPTPGASAAPGAASPSGSSAPAPPAMEVPDPKEYKARLIAAHRTAIDAHAQAPRDAEWSTETEKKLRDGLAPLAAASHFAVERVDCKTTTCVAVLAFASYPEAKARWQSVLTQPNRARCGTEVTLEDPVDPTQPYELTFVYECQPPPRP